MEVADIQALCARLSTEAEDRDERNAYDEIKRHIDQARPTKEGLLLDLAYMATDFQRRAGEIRQRAPLSALVDTLETKARICQELVGKLGGRVRL
jgi:hypothetical protein